MFVNDEDFHFAVSELRRYGYTFNISTMDTYIYIACVHIVVLWRFYLLNQM